MFMREAIIEDCEGIMKVLNSCILEKNSFSALMSPVNLEEEERFSKKEKGLLLLKRLKL